jgi:hypothetical protein
MASLRSRNAYRISRVARSGPRSAADNDVLTVLLLTAPGFVWFVSTTIVRGDRFGTGATVSAGMLVLTLAQILSSWRARRAGGES